LLYGDAYKNSFLQECRRVLKNDGFISFSGHDYDYLTEHHSQCVVGKNFCRTGISPGTVVAQGVVL
ncbi:MAG: hypothetical protein WAQ71_02025, partial [Limnochordia bacterium]